MVGGASKPPAGRSGEGAGNRDGLSLLGPESELGAEVEAITQVGRWEWDPKDGGMTWSEQQFRILGLEPGSVDPGFEAFMERVHPDDRARLDGALERALAGAPDLQLVHRVVRPGGEPRTVLSRARIFRDPAGDATRVFGATIDLTDSRRERERLREREARLTGLERTLRAGALEWDPVADRLEPSAGLETLLGAAPGSLAGPLARLLAMVAPERREEWRLDFGRVAGGEDSSPQLAQLERGDGSLLWAELRLEPADPAAPAPRLVRGAVQDVSRRRRVELESERQLEAARALAVRDPLTGLANRTLAIDRIGHAIAASRRRGTDLAVLFIDLDGFKQVNDEHGHDEGDLLIKEIGQRLRATVRSSDSVARYGGDEFLVLVEDAPGRDQATRAAGRVLAAFEAPFEVGERRHRISPSIGITMAGPQPTSPEQLIREADAAMYEAKAGGGATYRFAGPRSAAS